MSRLRAAPVLATLALMADGDGPQAQWDFSFPSAVSESRSPAGAMVLSYHDPGENPDGAHGYEFIVRGRSGTRQGGFVFLRSVNGSWSPGGENFFVNDYTGSNVTDCLVPQSETGRFSLVSLTQLLANQGRSNIISGSRVSFSFPFILLDVLGDRNAPGRPIAPKRAILGEIGEQGVSAVEVSMGEVDEACVGLGKHKP